MSNATNLPAQMQNPFPKSHGVPKIPDAARLLLATANAVVYVNISPRARKLHGLHVHKMAKVDGHCC